MKGLDHSRDLPSNTSRKCEPTSSCRRIRDQRAGFLLIVVLVTVIVLSLSAYTFSLLMIHEQSATNLMGRQIQSRYLVESGVDFVRMYLTSDQATIHAMGGVWDNADQFQNKIVSVNPQNPLEIGRFTIITSAMDGDGVPEGFRFGLTDESSKLNLNTLTHADTWLPDSGDGQGGGGRRLLMALPLMTEDVADAILDWLDEDDDVRDYGAETDFYASGIKPYAAKNGPMDSVEELLLIRGVTAQLLFGQDHNHNGILDLDEQYSTDGNTYDPDMQLGWANYLTLYSKESNLNPEGLERIYINNNDLNQLYDDLRSVFNEEWTNFIIAYRQNGPFSGEEPDGDPPRYLPADLSKEATTTFNQILDLVDAKTSVEYTDDEGETAVAVLDSPINMLNLFQTMPLLMSNLTTVEGDNIPGRINIMQAPRRILESIPGMTPEAVELILDKREFELDDPDSSDVNRKFETWILVENLVDLTTMKTMLPFVCAGGEVFKAEIVGYFDDSVATSRAEVILDTTVPLPRILFWRDKSHLQRGYTVDSLGTGLNY